MPFDDRKLHSSETQSSNKENWSTSIDVKSLCDDNESKIITNLDGVAKNNIHRVHIFIFDAIFRYIFSFPIHEIERRKLNEINWIH